MEGFFGVLAPVKQSLAMAMEGDYQNPGIDSSYQHELMDNYPKNLENENDYCLHCGEGFEVNEKIVQARNEKFHVGCFVCAQCFQPFPDGVYYNFDGRKYCEHDFHVLFAPCCGGCGCFIVGRVIKAMNSSWHPACFCCSLCKKGLADDGFVKHAGR
ncbi:unnamed protein product [Dibothriocephalus latus]|uniref:LIM zinc-binding domain-containing protein n=1 Tax=Dibothriocephalus latus TaxID=60516 RepID=A0A3P7M1K7_DIBLA|nr:unnamed protein product [Dibothriocephalus latus]